MPSLHDLICASTDSIMSEAMAKLSLEDGAFIPTPEDGECYVSLEHVNRVLPSHEKVPGCECFGCLAHFNKQGILSNAQGLTYDDWCKLKNAKQRSYADMYEFLSEVKLPITLNDPVDYPGLSYAIALVTMNKLQIKDLSDKVKSSIYIIMNRIYADQNIGDSFDEGQIVNKRWKVVKTLNDAQGYFNQGVHLVKDLKDNCQYTCVMKVLPSEAMFSGYAAREIGILYLLDHPNIIQFQDAYEPFHRNRHGAPWVVTDFCNGGTLETCMAKNRTPGLCVPELFVWHVFESLVDAIQYCHIGPQDLDPELWDTADWDPIYHRDIIPGNILLSNDKNTTDNSYPTIVLADFGCAVSKSEIEEKGLAINDMPEIDSDAIPPEGVGASEAQDIYQIGLVIQSLMRNNAWWAGHRSAWLRYTFDLRRLADMCAANRPDERPRASMVLDALRERKAYLLETGALKYEPLIS
jgi:serine/threonine protein kinase